MNASSHVDTSWAFATSTRHEYPGRLFVWVVMFGLSIPSVILARRTMNTKSIYEEERLELLEEGSELETST